MNEFSHILLASDYDRTMTAFDGSVPEANLRAAEEFMARGGAFTIATGRSLPMFRQPVRQLRLNAPVILANGAALWEPESGELTVLQWLSKAALEAVREMHERFPQLRLELQGPGGHRCFGRDDLRDTYLRRYGIEADYGGWDGVGQILSASFYAPFRAAGHVRAGESDPEEEAPFEEMAHMVAGECGGLLDPVRSMPRMIELMPAGCGKGRTARLLADRMGREVLLCAGDAPNDLPMLEEADEAFIPVTADPGVRGRGFTETAGCDDGVIASIVEMLRNRI